jgi:hypothetical protein
VTKRLGDTYQGYTITDITSSQMVLENGPRREVIPLFDGAKHQPQGGKTPILATRIVSFGGGGVSGGSQIAASGAVAAAVPVGRPAVPQPAFSAGAGSPSSLVNTIITPAQAQQMNAQTAGPARSAPAATPAPVRQPAPVTNIQQPAPTWNERTNEQGRRVIRTPFGDIIRDQPTNP